MPPRRPKHSFRRAPNNAPYSGGRKPKAFAADSLRPSEATSLEEKFEATRLAHSIDESMGFARYESGRKKVGWLCNMHSTRIEDENVPGGRAGVDFYFLEDDGGTFKATIGYDPYFVVACKLGFEAEVEEWLRRKFEGVLKKVVRVTKEDLQMVRALRRSKVTIGVVTGFVRVVLTTIYLM
jgi:DNA polymerase epsilon subunit 1